MAVDGVYQDEHKNTARNDCKKKNANNSVVDCSFVKHYNIIKNSAWRGK